MSSKYDGKDSYSDDGKDYDYGDSKTSSAKDDLPRIEITSIEVDGSRCPVSHPLDLAINFELDR